MKRSNLLQWLTIGVALAAGLLAGVALESHTARVRNDGPLACELAQELNRAMTTGPVAFTANGAAVSSAEVKLMEAALRREMKKATADEVTAAAKKRLVELVVAAGEARDLSTDATIALNARLSESARRLRAAAGIERLQQKATVTEAEAKALYDEERAKRGSEYLFRHIALDNEADAQKVAALAKAPGADFAALAGRYSVDRVTRGKGGLFGWTSVSVFSPAFAELLRATPVAAVGGPVLVDGHWQIVRVEETRAASMKPFDEVRADYEAAVKRQKATQDLTRLAGEAVVK